MKALRTLKSPIRTLIGVTAILMSLIGFVVLMYGAITQGNIWHIISFSIYGLSLVALWTISTVYHSLNVSNSANIILRQLDHAMIYFLIAGTYTPMCLIVLRGAWGWTLFGINWGLAISGVILKLIFREPPKIVGILLFTFYIIMGWLVVVAWIPLTRNLPSGGLFWLVWGGVFYTVGAMILGIKRLNITPWFGAHEIWHLFVMLGSFFHFWLMYKYVLCLN